MSYTTVKERLPFLLLCAAQFMTILDVTIVNVALPELGADVGLAVADLRWAVTAYTLAFGGLLLLGGRLAERLGRRNVFLAGLSLFTAGSLAAGLSGSAELLLSARVAQGVGAAGLSPAAVGLIHDLFPTGEGRNKAFAVWGAMGAAGAAVGVLAGGLVTDLLSWHWAFLVNVPIGVVVAPLAARLLPAPAGGSGRVDVLGAALAGGGIAALILALGEANDAGWGSLQTLGLSAGGVAALGAFLLWEGRAARPLVPRRLLAQRPVGAALALMLVASGAIVSVFFLLSLYLQAVLDHSALRTGLEFLAPALTIVLAAHVAGRALGRIGARALAAGGLTLTATGAALLSAVGAGGSYGADVLPGFLVLAFGAGLSFVAVTVTAMSNAPQGHLAVVGALNSTAHELGAALLVAVLGAIATADGAAPDALADGIGQAFAVAAAVAAGGTALALGTLRRGDVSADAAPAFAH